MALARRPASSAAEGAGENPGTDHCAIGARQSRRNADPGPRSNQTRSDTAGTAVGGGRRQLVLRHRPLAARAPVMPVGRGLPRDPIKLPNGADAVVDSARIRWLGGGGASSAPSASRISTQARRGIAPSRSIGQQCRSPRQCSQVPEQERGRAWMREERATSRSIGPQSRESGCAAEIRCARSRRDAESSRGTRPTAQAAAGAEERRPLWDSYARRPAPISLLGRSAWGRSAAAVRVWTPRSPAKKAMRCPNAPTSTPPQRRLRGDGSGADS